MGEQAAEVTTGLDRLAGLAYDRPTETDTLISDILRLVAESLDVGVAHLNRIEEGTLYVERVHNRSGMPVHVGDSLPLSDTY